MERYKVTTYADRAAYTVTIDEHGVVSIDGFIEGASEGLKTSVKRYMDKYGLSPLRALSEAVGPYSTVVEYNEDIVPEDKRTSEVL